MFSRTQPRFRNWLQAHVVKQGDFRHEKQSRTYNVLAMSDRINIYKIEILMNIHNWISLIRFRWDGERSASRSYDPDWAFSSALIILLIPPRPKSENENENEKRKTKKERRITELFWVCHHFRLWLEKEESNWGKWVTMPPKQVKETLAPKEQALFRQILVISLPPKSQN